VSFDGFISYSHAADGRVAPAVQRGLQSLAKPWHRRRALWIFRDQTGLAVTPALWSSIKQALDSSEYFVLMASPDAAKSPWVNKEIEHWVATKSPDKILPVVTDGEWRWDPERGDFADDSTAVPAALRRVFTEEPLYLDLRWARDEGQLSLRHSRFRDGIAQLAAPMHGISKDDLEGEDVRQHRRARRLWSMAVAALALLTLVASLTGVLAVRNADRANASAAEAVRQQARASEQEDNAGRSAQEANRQLENARLQEVRAKEAVQETRRQEQRAQRQRELADRASADAARQQVNARRQQQAAQRAAQRAQEQQALAEQQGELARKSAAEGRRQKTIAEQQQRLAQAAKEEARRQKKAADKAAADARRQQANAHEQQRLAAEAAAEARKEKANAEQQRRIAIGRRLMIQAEALIKDEPQTALMLGTAAVSIQSDDRARRQLTGLVASTRYAGTLNDVRRLAYSTNDVIVVAGSNNRLTLRAVADRTGSSPLADIGVFKHWALSPDGRTLAAAADNDPAVLLMDVTRRPAPQVIGVLPVNRPVGNITFSQDGRSLFIGARDSDAGDAGDLWDVSQPGRPKPLATDFASSSAVTEAAFSPDGNTLVTRHEGHAPTVWDLSSRTTAKPVASLSHAVVNGNSVHAMAFLRNAPTLVASGTESTMLIDLSTPAAPAVSASMPEGGFARSVVVSKDGRLLLILDWSGAVTVRAVGRGAVPTKLDSIGGPQNMEQVALSPDGRTLTTPHFDGTATQWDVAGYGAPRSRGDLTGDDGQGQTAAFTADRRSMYTVGSSPQAVVWDVTGDAGAVRRGTATVHDRPIAAAAATPDGRFLAAGSQSGRVTVSDMTDPLRPKTVATIEEDVVWMGDGNDLAISPDGGTLAVADRTRSVVLWDVTKTPATRLGPLPRSSMPAAFSPVGRTVAVREPGDTQATVWALGGPTGPVERGSMNPPVRSPIRSMAFSPDGKTVVLGGFDSATMWDVSQAVPRQTGRLLNPGSVTSILFGADGQTVVTMNPERAVMWEVADTEPVPLANFRLLTTAPVPGRARVTATLSPDGRTLVAGWPRFVSPYPKGTATLWDFGGLAELRADPARQACAATGRGLTENEWAGWIPELRFQRTC
jgi:WD40 repeat protein